jgi:glutamate dehydrogenase
LVPALDIVELAGATGLDVAAAAEVYFALGERLELDWLRDQIVALPRDTHWDAMARAALRDDVYAERAALAAEVLRASGGLPSECIEAWLSHNEAAVGRCLQMVGEIHAAGSPDLARLSVAVREFRNLIDAAKAPEGDRANSGSRSGLIAPRFPVQRLVSSARLREDGSPSACCLLRHELFPKLSPQPG